MRDSIKQGLNFYQWLASQNPKPHKSKMKVLQLRYEQVEDFYQHPLNPDKPIKQYQKFVVIDLNGWPRKAEWRAIIVHPSEKLAGEHGKEFYDYRQFLVIPLSKYQNSQAARQLKVYNRTLNKLKIFKPTRETK